MTSGDPAELSADSGLFRPSAGIGAELLSRLAVDQGCDDATGTCGTDASTERTGNSFGGELVVLFEATSKAALEGARSISRRTLGGVVSLCNAIGAASISPEPGVFGSDVKHGEFGSDLS